MVKQSLIEGEVPEEGKSASRLGRLRRPLLAVSGGVGIAGLFYFFPPVRDWTWEGILFLMALIGPSIAIAWSQGMFLPIGVGLVLYFLDNLFGFRAHTWFKNYTASPERRITHSEHGFIAGRDAWSQFKMAMIVMVAYMAIQLGIGTPNDEFVGSYLMLLQEYALVARDAIFVFLGVCVGFILARILGSILVRMHWAFTFGSKRKFSNMPLFGAFFRAFVWVYQTAYDWGHEKNVITDEERDANIAAQALPRHRSRLVWFCRYLCQDVLRFFFRRRKTLFGKALRTLVLIVTPILLFVTREAWQSPLVDIVNNVGYVAIFLVMAGLVYGLFSLISALFKNNLFGKVAGGTVAAALVLFALKFAGTVDQHVRMFAQYHNGIHIERVQVADLPETVGIRVHPLVAIRQGAGGNFSGAANTITDPNFMVVGDELMWTFTAEPTNWRRRALEPATTLFQLPATEATVRFNQESGSRVDVCFPVYQNGIGGRNAFSAARRSLPLLKYLNHDPRDVRPMLNDVGEWVQVVSLTRYVGFPRREVFGGVVVFEQCQDDSTWLREVATSWGVSAESAGFLDVIPGQTLLRREFTGGGQYISPEEIYAGDYPFLYGNQLQDETAQQAIARSLRYRRGVQPVWWASLEGDVFIADRDSVDYNEMPHFSLWQFPGEEPAIFGNFILSKQGSNDLTYEVWIPGDGRVHEETGLPIVYVFDAEEEGVQQNGTLKVSGLIKGTQGETFWDNRKVIEVMSYAPRIAGEVRSLMMARVAVTSADGVVTYNSRPSIFMVDPTLRLVHRIEDVALPQSEWNTEIEAAFGPEWGIKITNVVSN